MTVAGRCWLGGILVWLAAAGAGAAGPTQLTQGPGNDTDAAWSPDGRQIVFQTDRGGSLDLYLLEVGTRAIRPLVTGPGESAFPAWSPDGKWIVYSHGEMRHTALEGQDDGYNLFLVSAAGGPPRPLTRGRVRDYCPVFSPDGKHIWFSSDRGGNVKSNAVGLFSIAVEGGEPSAVVQREGVDHAAVAASFSADGRHLVYGSLSGFRDNWALRLARTAAPAEGFPLTDARDCFYGPRFAPTGTVLACTGFQVGDAGWGVYTMDAQTTRRQRLATGPGNARSPAWSPDGRQIVYENNGSGTYKLYCLEIPPLPAGPPPISQDSGPAPQAVLRFSFAQHAGETIADLSPRGNTGRILGAPEWKPPAASFRAAGASVVVRDAQGFDFGAGPFCVRAVVQVPDDCKFAMIAMGEYPGNRLGWQLFITADRRAAFNSRTTDLIYRGTRSDDPLPAGRAVTLIGQRDAVGGVRMYVDGAPQRTTAEGALYAYGPPLQVRIGAQHDGSATFPGWISEVAVYRGALPLEEARRDALRRFWKEIP